MLGGNGIRVYGLDQEALAKIAVRIGPTMDEVNEPLRELPSGWHGDVLGQ
jgi:hypothetical protein